MKIKASTSRKLRYGGVTAALTAAIIAIIILVNVIFSALSQKFLWYKDITPELLFTLSDECIDLIENGDPTFANSTSPIKKIDEFRASKKASDPDFKDEDLMIRIIFCDEPDKWEEDTAQRYVYETAKQLRDKFPSYISIENVNVVRNPTAVTKYGSTLSPSSVIIDFNGEFRVRSIKNFYTFDSDTSDEPWGYNGEKIFMSAILAVTRVETPVACLTVNHEEEYPDEEFVTTLSIAGYDIRTIDLASEDIPDDCRLLVVFNPHQDFLVADGVSEIDEIEKLDAFLDGTNSMMVFMSSELTTPLTNFESYLEEWGIKYDRHTEADGTVHPYRIQDTSQALTTDGFTVKAEYYSAGGAGTEITEELTKNTSNPPMIVFKDAMSISYSDIYTPTHMVDKTDSTKQYDCATYYADGVSRSIHDVFVTSDSAIAMANGTPVKTAKYEPFKLMTVSVEERSTQEDNYGYSSVNEASYVIACGSTDFASRAMLQASYGNNAFVEYALRTVGREPVPVGLTWKPFGDLTIDTVTTKEATQYTLVLTLVPAILSMGIGIFVIVRRKNR